MLGPGTSLGMWLILGVAAAGRGEVNRLFGKRLLQELGSCCSVATRFHRPPLGFLTTQPARPSWTRGHGGRRLRLRCPWLSQGCVCSAGQHVAPEARRQPEPATSCPWPLPLIECSALCANGALD